jgi:PAS domain S-box-containing protein
VTLSTLKETLGEESLFRAMIEEAPICIAMFDREMRYLAASRRWLAHFSLGESKVIGRRHYDVVPDLPERWKEIHKRGLSGETLKKDDDPFQRPDGRTAWLSWEVRPWRRPDGEIGGIIIFINDVTSRVEAEQAARESNAKLAAETKALARLDEASSRLWQTEDLREGLAEMLAATIELLGADKGNVQLWDAERKVLLIAAQRGFEQDFLEFFREVSAADDSACGRALRTGKTVVIEDVERDEPFVPFLPIARAAGFRAVVSAPVLSRGGVRRGVLSAHFSSPHRPSDTDLRRLDLYRRRAAAFIERYSSGQALRDSEERLRLAVEASRMGMWDRDMRADKTTWNDEYHRLLGYHVGEVEPGHAAWMPRVHPDDRAATEAKVASAMREHKEYLNEYRVLRPDGTVRWCVARGEFFYDEAGKPIRMVGLAEDVTEARQQAERQRVLVAELQHRTRNLMAVVQSIAQQTMARAASLEDFEGRFARRLAALSRVQSLLSRADSEPITLGALVATELEALGPDKLGDKVTLAGPETPLRNRAVQMLSLAIHELATNALKYGALATEDGSLSVTWRIEGAEPDRRLSLEWIERGIAAMPPAADAARRGYGRTLIEEALPYTLSARTTFELGADTLRCLITLPVTTKDGGEVAG